MGEFRFTIEGKPEPGGSKKAFPARYKKDGKWRLVRWEDEHGNEFCKINITDDNDAVKAWKDLIAWTAKSGWKGRPLVTAPLEAVMIFYRRRPADHWTSKGELSAKGKRNPFPTTKPDVLKYGRPVEDALSEIVYRDDNLIVDEHLYKRYKGYDDPERVEVVLRDVQEDVLAQESPQEALSV